MTYLVFLFKDETMPHITHHESWRTFTWMIRLFRGKSTISSLSSYYEGVGLRAPSERKPSCQEEIELWKRVPGKMTSRMWAADKRLHGGVKLVNWSTFFVNWSTSSAVEDVSFHLCARCRVWEQVVKQLQSICKNKNKNKKRLFV